jgi:para-aminobenzoate synthetase component 1
MAASGGSWLGWLAYEAGAWVEPAAHWPSPDMAVLWAARHDPLIHFDRLERQCWLEGQDTARLAAMEARILALEASSPPADPAWPGVDPDRWHWHTTSEGFEEGVRRLRGVPKHRPGALPHLGWERAMAGAEEEACGKSAL